MSTDPIWKAFADSGYPLYYLLYKAVTMDSNRSEEKESSPK
jgi:hypothetical protein